MPDFNWLDLGPWVGQDPPSPDWTVHGIIPREETTLFSGHGGTGKSTLALHLCVAQALAIPWLKFGVTGGSAFFIDAEDRPVHIWRRLEAICRNYAASIADVIERLFVRSLHGQDAVMATVDKGGHVLPTELYTSLLEQAATHEPQIIVIASAANVFAGDENNRSQVTQFIALMTRLAVAAHGSTILISHPSLTGLVSGSQISGSTGWHNSVRSRLTLEKTGANGSGLRCLSVRKNQHGPDDDTVTLEWRNGMFLEPARPTDYERAKADYEADVTFRDLFRKAAERGERLSPSRTSRTYPPNVFAKDPGANGFRKTDFEAAMTRAFEAGTAKIVTVRVKGEDRTYVTLTSP